MKAPLVKLVLVREAEFSYKRMTCAKEISQIVGEMTKGDFDESLFVLSMDAKNRILNCYMASKGGSAQLSVKIADLFRVALISGANAVALAHNHPCGDPSPSPEDLSLWKNFKDAAKVLGLRALDNVVIGENGSYWSAQEKGEL